MTSLGSNNSINTWVMVSEPTFKVSPRCKDILLLSEDGDKTLFDVRFESTYEYVMTNNVKIVFEENKEERCIFLRLFIKNKPIYNVTPDILEEIALINKNLQMYNVLPPCNCEETMATRSKLQQKCKFQLRNCCSNLLRG
jgi:hypothetical protein